VQRRLQVVLPLLVLPPLLAELPVLVELEMVELRLRRKLESRRVQEQV
jgi:hypothetical protein